MIERRQDSRQLLKERGLLAGSSPQYRSSSAPQAAGRRRSGGSLCSPGEKAGRAAGPGPRESGLLSAQLELRSTMCQSQADHYSLHRGSGGNAGFHTARTDRPAWDIPLPSSSSSSQPPLPVRLQAPHTPPPQDRLHPPCAAPTWPPAGICPSALAPEFPGRSSRPLECCHKAGAR